MEFPFEHGFLNRGSHSSETIIQYMSFNIPSNTGPVSSFDTLHYSSTQPAVSPSSIQPEEIETETPEVNDNGSVEIRREHIERKTYENTGGTKAEETVPNIQINKKEIEGRRNNVERSMSARSKVDIFKPKVYTTLCKEFKTEQKRGRTQ